MKSRKKAVAYISILSALLLFVTFTSCKKKCNFPDNVDSGVIVQDVIIYPNSGGMTSSMAGDFVIDGSSPYADAFEVRYSPTMGKTNVNYSQYNLMAYPMNVTCDASFERSVEIIDSLSLVRYSITVYECLSQKCNETRTIENYVLVPVLPPSYNVEYIVKREKI